MIQVKESDEFTAVVPVANNGEDCTHAERLGTAQALTNRTRHHENTLRGTPPEGIELLLFSSLGSGEIVENHPVPTQRLGADNLFTGITTRTLKMLKFFKERVAGLKTGDNQMFWDPFFMMSADFPNWEYKTVSGIQLASQKTATSSAQIRVPLPGLPKAGVIKTVSVRCKGIGHSAKPANMPSIALERYVATAGGLGVADLGAQTDASVDQAAYDAAHLITISGLSENLANPSSFNTIFYRVRISGEHGTNSLPDGFVVYSIELTITGAT